MDHRSTHTYCRILIYRSLYQELTKGVKFDTKMCRCYSKKDTGEKNRQVIHKVHDSLSSFPNHNYVWFKITSTFWERVKTQFCPRNVSLLKWTKDRRGALFPSISCVSSYRLKASQGDMSLHYKMVQLHQSNCITKSEKSHKL